jgi:ferredoxin-NADP reductase
MNLSAKNPATERRTLLGQLGHAARAVGDAFAWPLRTSDYLALVNPLWTRHALLARVESAQDETADARTLTLRPAAGFRRHRAGQYVRVGVPIDGKHYTRTYSISSAPERDDECITISVKAVPGGRVSQHLVRQVKVGDYLSISLPQGEFVLPDAAPIKPLFISAGSGITPIMSMLRSLIARDRLPDVVHVHYAPAAHDVIFGAELRELAEKHPRYTLRLLHTRLPGDTDQVPMRHFHGAQLERLCPDWRERDVYACGPEALLSAVEKHYRAAGLASRVQTERFRAARALAPSAVSEGLVRFSKSAKDARSDGVTNLLRLAEDSGLNPAHGCRMGICHGCTAVLKSGCVRDLRTNALINEPGHAVQICVCAAAGDADIEL